MVFGEKRLSAQDLKGETNADSLGAGIWAKRLVVSSCFTLLSGGPLSAPRRKSLDKHLYTRYTEWSPSEWAWQVQDAPKCQSQHPDS